MRGFRLSRFRNIASIRRAFQLFLHKDKTATQDDTWSLAQWLMAGSCRVHKDGIVDMV